MSASVWSQSTQSCTKRLAPLHAVHCMRSVMCVRVQVDRPVQLDRADPAGLAVLHEGVQLLSAHRTQSSIDTGPQLPCSNISELLKSRKSTYQGPTCVLPPTMKCETAWMHSWSCSNMSRCAPHALQHGWTVLGCSMSTSRSKLDAVTGVLLDLVQ